MIAYLKGKFSYKSPAFVHMDINGVGYEVQISLNTYSKIQSLDNGLLHTYLQIKEDAHTLYGFFELAEKEMFVQLISVSGIGASTARMMLSSLQPAEISRAIIQGNEKLLESIKGIGKKTAQRVVLELKDKLSKQTLNTNFPALENNTLESDAFNALASLGIMRGQAEIAVKKALAAHPDIDKVEELIKKALQLL